MAGNGWGTAQTWYSYTRKTQAWNSYTYTSNSSSVTYTVTGYARSGDGSGSYYAADWGCTVTIYRKIGNGSWVSLGSTYAVLNYGNSVGTITKSFTVNRTHSSQAVYFKTEVTSSDWPTASSQSSTSVNALASYTVSYNANGGSGAPSSQTKWYGEALALSSTKPTRTGYAFQGWSTSSTSSTVSYSAGASYTANAAATLYAVWRANTYTVSYAANGGSSTPSNQTKTYGVALALASAISHANATATYTVTFNANGGSSTGISGNKATSTKTTKYTFSKWRATNGTQYNAGANYTADEATTMTAQWTSSASTTSVTLPSPTRADYTFDGWYTAASGGTRVGGAGASYTPSASVTLYAHWTLAYTAPTLGTLTAFRCLSNGTRSDTGTYCKCTLSWTAGSKSVTGVSFRAVNGSSTYSGSGTVSGTTATCTFGGGNLDTELRYTVTATLTDAAGKSYSKTTVLTPSFFTLDFLEGGRGVAIGQAAGDTGFHVAMDETVEGKYLILKSGNIEDGTAPSSATHGNGQVRFADSGGDLFGILSAVAFADGRQGLRLNAYRVIGGAGYNCGVYLSVDSSGNPSVSFSTGGQAAWLSALGLDVTTADPELDNASASIFRLSKQLSTVVLNAYQLKVSSALAASSSVSLGTGIIPSAYRPSVASYIPVVTATAGRASGIFLRVTHAGDVTLYNYSGNSLAATTNLFATGTWMV